MESAPWPLAGVWKDFFVTAAGASAALVGLVIVAISVNVQRILETPQLPSRGGATVAALALILVSSMAELIPQSSSTLGIEITVFGFLVWMLQIWSGRQILLAYLQSRERLRESLIGLAIGQIQAIPFIIGGVILFLHRPTGLYWIAWGMIATFILSLVNAWSSWWRFCANARERVGDLSFCSGEASSSLTLTTDN
jgi:hypothetical protein